MMPRWAYGALMIAPWVAWLICWTLSAFKNKPVLRREGWLSRVSYLMPLATSIFLLADRRVLSGWLTQVYVPPAARLTVYWIGIALILLGLGFAVWARRHLGGNWSGTVTVKEGHELIRTGPYAWVRHPIYTGLLFAVLGTALGAAQWRGLIAVLLTFVGFVIKLRIEERYMVEQFPEAYPAYRAEVAALIPGIY